MEKSIRAREQRLRRWHKLGQLMRTDTVESGASKVMIDVEKTETPCPECGAKLEIHAAPGPLGALRERDFCPSCKYSTQWRLLERRS